MTFHFFEISYFWRMPIKARRSTNTKPAEKSCRGKIFPAPQRNDEPQNKTQ